MLTPKVMDEFALLQSIIEKTQEPFFFSNDVPGDIQNEIYRFRDLLFSESDAVLKSKKVARENYLKGCFRYLDCLDSADEKQMNQIELVNYAFVYNLSWGYLALCIMAYADKGQGLFMKDFIKSLQGDVKLDNLFKVAKCRNIVSNGLELVRCINCTGKNPIEDCLQSMREAGFIDSSNKAINGTTEQELAGFCQYLAQQHGIDNWANAFAVPLQKKNRNLSTAAAHLSVSPNYDAFLSKRGKLK